MTQGFEDNFVNKIICGDAQMVMQQLPKAVFNCAITSPPYWGLRAYQTTPVVWGNRNCRHEWGNEIVRQDRGAASDRTAQTGTHKKGVQPITVQQGQFCSLCSAWRGELGLEPTPELYIEHLMTVFDGVKRVLRKDGVLFVNIGDSYGTSSGAGSRAAYKQGTNKGSNYYEKIGKPGLPGLEKSLCAIPERFVLAMMARGWIRRCTIIWAKGLSFCDTYSGSCMPDSCKDRPNKNGFEYVYMFTKSKKYFYEQQFEELSEAYIKENRPPGVLRQRLYPESKYNKEVFRPKQTKRTTKNSGGHRSLELSGRGDLYNPLGRTIRNVWTINPQPFSEAHFATFPEKLVEICLKLGCPEFVCKKCGLPRSKIYEANTGGTIGKGGWLKQRNDLSQGMNIDKNSRNDSSIKKGKATGLTDCGCGEGFRPGITFDPFMGSGTVAIGAYKNRRGYCGIELSEEYVRMAEARLDEAKQQYSLLEPNKEA